MRLRPAALRLLLAFGLAAPLLGARERVLVPVSVNGTTMRFTLDTGAGVPLLLWRDVADWTGLKYSAAAGSVPAGQIAVGFSDPAQVEFFGHEFSDARLAIATAPDFAKWEQQGLLGWPAFRDNLWLFDLGSNQIHPLDRLPDDLSGWIKWPLRKDSDTLIAEIPAAQDSPGGAVLIDTGSDGGISLSPALWQQWRQAHPAAPVTCTGSYMLNGFAAVPEAAADRWSLGGLTLRQVLLSPAPAHEVASVGASYLATLGSRALKRLRLIVDSPHGAAYVQAIDTPAPFPSYNRFGAAPAPSGDKTLLRVLPDTPAARAGLADGDELLKVNGVDLLHWQHRPGPGPLAGLFTQAPGTVVDLTVRHDSRSRNVRAPLEEIFAAPDHTVGFRGDPPWLVPQFHLLPPSAALLARARAIDLPVRQFAGLDPAAPVLRQDDKATLLVTVVDDRSIRQWLVLLVANALKPNERQPRPALHYFSTTGHELSLERHPQAIAIRSVGPVRGSDARDCKDEWSGIIASQEFLLRGFEGVSPFMRKLAAHRLEVGYAADPFPADKIHPPPADAALTIEDERSFVGGSAALTEFLLLSGNTPGLRDVLLDLVDASWRDYVRGLNISVNFIPDVDADAAALWALPPDASCEAIAFVISVNGRERLLCRAIVTRPVGPFATTAGLLALVAGRADGSGAHVMVRVLATRPGPAR